MSANEVFISGIVFTSPAYAYTYKNRDYYKFYVSCLREGGRKDDLIPVIASEKISPKKGDAIWVDGRIKTRKEKRGATSFYLFAEHIKKEDSKESLNLCFCEGIVCQEPSFFVKKRKIKVELKIAVNDSTNKETAYIPVILWQENALLAKDLKLGDKVSLTGKIRSRIYLTKEKSTKRTYEVAAAKIIIPEESKCTLMTKLKFAKD